MKPLTDADRVRIVLRMIQDKVDRAHDSIVDSSAFLAALNVRKDAQDEYNESNYGGGFSQNPYDENVRRGEVALEANKEELSRWKDIYQFTLNTFFKDFVK